MGVPFGGIEVKLCGKILQQDFCLVFHFIMQGTYAGNQIPHDNPAVSQASAFGELQAEFRSFFYQTRVLPVRSLTSTDTLFEEAVFDYRMLGIAPEQAVYNVAGLAAGTPLPTFTAMSFVSPPVPRPYKRASKRIPGLTETMWNGVLLDGTFADEREEVETNLGQEQTPITALTGWSSLRFTPVVVRRQEYVNSQGVSVFGVPDDYLQWQYASVAGDWSLRRIGTQNSRKS